MAQANIKAVITAEDRASAALKNFGNNASTMGSKIKKGLKLAAVATAAAGAAAIAFGVSSVKSYQESENALTQLRVALKATKGVAKVSEKSMVAFANSMQKVTKFSDEEILSAEALQLTFKAIGKDIFPRVTKAAMDMSEFLGKDLNSTMTQLGKAMQDPVKGATALSKQGSLAKTELQHLRDMAASGSSIFEQQTYILEALESQYKGAAEAAGLTFAGKLKILGNQFDEIKESIGKVIVDALLPLMNSLSAFVASDQFQLWLTNLTNWLKINLPLAIAWLKDEGIPFLQKAFNALWPVIQTTANVFKRIIEFMNNNQWVIWALIAVLGSLKVAFAIAGVISKFKAALAGARAAYVLTSAVLSVPIAITVLAGAALIAMGLIIAKAKETMAVLDQLGEAQRMQGDSFDSATKGLRDLAKNGTPAQRKRAKATLNNPAYYSQKANATGTDFFGGGMSLVGERGPEMVTLPRGSKVSRADETKRMMGGSTTINITVPMMTGSANERRKVARMLIKDIQDIAGMNGQSVADMMSSNYGLVS